MKYPNKDVLFPAIVKAVEATIKQGKQSVNSSGDFCMYRGPDGLKCIVGHMIPDDLYTEDMEDRGPDTLEVRPVLEQIFDSVLSEEELNLLKEVQGAHDGTLQEGFLEGFKRNLNYSDLPEDLLQLLKPLIEEEKG